MLYPADYVEQWGRKYGIGLGSVPVSEALVNAYEQGIGRHPTDSTKTGFPVATCRAQVDLVEYPEDKPPDASLIAVVALNDPTMEKRYPMMVKRQLEHSPELRALRS
jgi:hypothetical protein